MELQIRSAFEETERSCLQIERDYLGDELLEIVLRLKGASELDIHQLKAIFAAMQLRGARDQDIEELNIRITAFAKCFRLHSDSTFDALVRNRI